MVLVYYIKHHFISNKNGPHAFPDGPSAWLACIWFLLSESLIRNLSAALVWKILIVGRACAYDLSVYTCVSFDPHILNHIDDGFNML